MRKIFNSAETALDGILRDGMTIACGGFGTDLPHRLATADVKTPTIYEWRLT